MEFVVKIGADQQGLNETLSRMKQTFTAQHALGGGLLSSLSGLFTVGSITALSKATIDWAGKLRDVADALGVNVQWLQKMQNGAKLVGADIEDVGKFITEMNKARENALNDPKGKDAQAFKRLGVSGGDIQNLSTQAFFDKIVKAFANGATTQLVNDVQEVGGKSARNLIAAFSAQFASDAPLLAEDLVDQLDEIGDAFTELKTKLMVDLSPAILATANATMNLVATIKILGAMIGGASVKPISKGEIVMGLLTSPATVVLNRLFQPDAQTAGADEIIAQEKQNAAIADGRSAAKEARRRREQDPPLFSSESSALDEAEAGSIGRDAKSWKFFEADAMAQAGLFTGSSLLINPDFSVQKEQLQVLQQINGKIGHGAFD